MRRFANCIPVFKDQPTKNIKSFQELYTISNKNNVLFGIFPEGRVIEETDLQQFQKGAAYFSYKTKFHIIPIYLHNTHRGFKSKRWIHTFSVSRGIISLIVSSFKKVYIFIGDPIDPIAENIIEDLKDQSNIKKYRQIIENIHEALIEEFLELKNEAAILFNATGKNLEMGDLDDEMADNA